MRQLQPRQQLQCHSTQCIRLSQNSQGIFHDFMRTYQRTEQCLGNISLGVDSRRTQCHPMHMSRDPWNPALQHHGIMGLHWTIWAHPVWPSGGPRCTNDRHNKWCVIQTPSYIYKAFNEPRPYVDLLIDYQAPPAIGSSDESREEGCRACGGTRMLRAFHMAGAALCTQCWVIMLHC